MMVSSDRRRRRRASSSILSSSSSSSVLLPREGTHVRTRSQSRGKSRSRMASPAAVSPPPPAASPRSVSSPGYKNYKSIRHDNGDNGDDGDDGDGGNETKKDRKVLLKAGTQIYVMDPHYAWLPATLQHDIRKGDATARVSIRLPSNWEDFTVVPALLLGTASSPQLPQSPQLLQSPRLSRSPRLSGMNMALQPPLTSRASTERTIRLYDYAIRVKCKQQDEHQRNGASEDDDDEDDVENDADDDVSTVISSSSSTTLGTSSDVASTRICLRMPLVNAGDNSSKSDMADLLHLHGPAVLYNIKERHTNLLPYTRVRDIIVAVNPFQWLPNLYSEDAQSYYADRIIWHTYDESPSPNHSPNHSPNTDILRTIQQKPTYEPHVYEISSQAYADLAIQRQNQTILVSGVSGSGKTVTVKVIMTHLSILEMTRPTTSLATTTTPFSTGSSTGSSTGFTTTTTTATVFNASSFFVKSNVVTKILESNPIFEAFGNATTIHNDNSSRFGKFQRLQFDIGDLPTHHHHQQQQGGEKFKGNKNVLRRSLYRVKSCGDDDDDDGGGGKEGERIDYDPYAQQQQQRPPQPQYQRIHRQQRLVPNSRMTGSICHTYLLEKTRVTNGNVRVMGERNFHIFYQLLASPESFREFLWKDGFVIDENDDEDNKDDPTDSSMIVNTNESRMKTASDFQYLGGNDVDAIPGMSDTQNWISTESSLQLFGISGNELHVLLRALCIVLQLGNLTFDSDPSRDHDNSHVSSPRELTKLTRLLGGGGGITEIQLETAFTKKRLDMRNGSVQKRLVPKDAKEGCDAFAREIYSRVFDYLVRKMNQLTDANRIYSAERASRFGSISLLDIFGFENMTLNKFEQLCINYANERIQNRYVMDNFRAITDEYVAEGLDMADMFDYRLVDNRDVMGLLSGKVGIIVALNEECLRPQGSDNAFVYKVKVVHENSTCLVHDHLLAKNEFAIRHYADTVKYTADKFVERNSDRLPQSLVDVACQSSNSIIREQFTSLREEKETVHQGLRKRAAHTVLSKFQSQLNALMASMDGTKTRYIRCIKPNSEKRPLVLDQKATMNQLESAGLVTAIVIARESFPKSMAYEMVLRRFGFLCFRNVKPPVVGTGDLKADVEIIVKTLLPMDRSNGRVEYPWRLGKTKVFFRAGALERMEDRLQTYVHGFVVRIQSWIRSIQHATEYCLFRECIIHAQALCRGRIQRNRYAKKIQMLFVLQRACRCAIARRKVSYLRRHVAATKIQSRWRAYTNAREFRNMVCAATKIQRIVRFGRDKNVLLAQLVRVVDAARTEQKRLKIQNKIQTIGKNRRLSADKTLVDDLESTYTNILEEVAELRSVNIALSQQLHEERLKYQTLESKMLTAQAEALVATSNANRIAMVDELNTAERLKKKAQLAIMKAQHKSALRRAEDDKVEISRRYEEELRLRDAKIATLESILAKEQKQRIVADVKCREKSESKEEKYERELLKLRQELKETQSAHGEYLSKLMDVLDNTHRARERELEKQKMELAATKQVKDAEILELRTEVIKLRGKKEIDSISSSSPPPPLQSKPQSSSSSSPSSSKEESLEVKSLKAEIELLNRKLAVNKLQVLMRKERGARKLMRTTG